jgi:hypothetical protein
MRTVIVLLLSLLCAVKGIAGGEEDARAVGMARAQVAVAENTEAGLWNPAALGIASRNPGKWVINFASFGFRVGNNIFSIPQYNKYNGGVWDEEDKKDILKLFKGEDRFAATGDAAARALSVQFKQMSVDFTFSSTGNSEIPREMVDVLLNDFVVGEKTVTPNGNVQGDVLFSTGLSAGQSLKKWIPVAWRDLSIGGTLRYYSGLTHVHSRRLDARIQQSDSLISSGAYDILESQGGGGASFDVGLLAEIDEKWSAGLTLHNLFSGISWTRKTKRSQGSYTVATDGIINLEDDLETEDTVIKGKSFTRSLPSIVRAGVGYRAGAEWLLAGDIEYFINDVKGESTPRAAIGMEYRPQYRIAWRSGFSIGGDNRGFNWAGGVGFYWTHIRFDLATNNLEGLLTLKRFSLSMGLKGYF